MQPTSILIVEEDFSLAEQIKSQLIAAGYHISGRAQSGEDAVIVVEKLMPDVILMAVKLAGDLDGIETAKMIRSRWQIPIIFLMSHTEQSLVRRAIQVLPSGCLTKPVRSNELNMAVELALYHYRVNQARQMAEVAFKESQEKYRRLIEISPEMIAILDRQRRILYINKAGIKLLEADRPSQIVGKSLSHFVEMGRQLDFEDLLDKGLQELHTPIAPAAFSLVYNFKTMTGSVLRAHLIVTPFHFLGNLNYQVIARDTSSLEEIAEYLNDECFSSPDWLLSTQEESSLVMCRHCKRVMDELGNWQDVEDYSVENAEIRVSFQVCPYCRRRKEADPLLQESLA